MAELADGRVYKRKRIKDPTDANNYIDIPVLYQANFKTVQEQAQESILYFNNSSASSRKVHTKRVTNPNDGSYVDVERIEEWYSKTAAEQAQEHTHVLKNTDPPPVQPNGNNNPAHEQTHVVRFFKDNAPGSQTAWIDVELIDCLRIVDASSQYQEWYWYLKHPEIGSPVPDSNVSYSVTAGNCDSSLELAPVEANFDPPYRLDPFQNIVNCKWTSDTEPGTGSGWIFWMQARWEGSHARTLALWVQMDPGDPPYTVRDFEIDYGIIGGVPFEDFDFGGFYWITGDSAEHYRAQVDALALEAAWQGKYAVMEFRIGENWTA